MNKLLNKGLWALFAFLAIGVGLYPALYFIIDRHFGLLKSKPEELLSNTFWNFGFYGHIILGGIALLIGWIQFSKKIRKERITIHRRIGMLYVVCALISGCCGIAIGFYATGGLIAQIGFILLGIIWVSSTFMAFIYAKNNQITKHQKVMIFSYAACFAAVTLRIWLPQLINYFQGEFIPAYRIVAWLCWVPNMVVAWLLVRRI